LGKISKTIPAPPKTLWTEDEKLDKAVLNRIESLIQEIADEEVQKSLRQVLIEGAKLERSRGKPK
jgi:hypothetical protein